MEGGLRAVSHVVDQTCNRGTYASAETCVRCPRLGSGHLRGWCVVCRRLWVASRNLQDINRSVFRNNVRSQPSGMLERLVTGQLDRPTIAIVIKHSLEHSMRSRNDRISIESVSDS